MKTTLLLACLALLLSTGCANHYDLTLYNGNCIRASSRPKMDDKGYWVFKDALGRDNAINALRVRKIEAVTPGDPPSKDFD